MELLENMVKKDMKSFDCAKVGGSVKEEEIECHNGKKINVNRIPAKDAYKFSLRLLDVLFTKEELHDHLLLPSKKSEKPPLDKCRVNLMFDLIDKRFGKKWDLSEVTKCCNQKCRDAINYLSGEGSD